MSEGNLEPLASMESLDLGSNHVLSPVGLLPDNPPSFSHPHVSEPSSFQQMVSRRVITFAECVVMIVEQHTYSKRFVEINENLFNSFQRCKGFCNFQL